MVLPPGQIIGTKPPLSSALRTMRLAGSKEKTGANATFGQEPHDTGHATDTAALVQAPATFEQLDSAPSNAATKSASDESLQLGPCAALAESIFTLGGLLWMLSPSLQHYTLQQTPCGQNNLGASPGMHVVAILVKGDSSHHTIKRHST